METIAETFPIFANVCNMCCRGYPVCVVGVSLIAMQSYDFLLKYPLRQTDDCDFHIIGQEIFNVFLYFCR